MVIYDKKGSVLLDIEVDDTSVRYKAIKGENSLTLKYSLAEHVEVPIGSYCVFKNERYYLMSPENFTMKHRRNFEYDLVMFSEDAKAKRYKFRNPVDGRLKFSLTAKPEEHLQMFVDNMNMRDGKGYWTVGECPDHVEIVLSYNHTFCYDALVQLADELELDYWFNGNEVNIGKLEINKENPLPLSYGGDGEGLKADIKRTNYSDALPIEVLYVQGGEQNIDPSKYGASELHLPKSQTIGYDGEHFEDEVGFNTSKARYYETDENGYYICRSDKEIANHSEDSLDCSEIYPSKEETIESVEEVNADKHFYDILFKSSVDYGEYVIGGENATVIFQSGMLAGKEFDLATDTDGNLVCKQEEGSWRVEIVPQDIDGITMPDKNSGFLPVSGDTFKVYGIQLPDEYIADNGNKSGAEWEMFRYAVKHLYSNEDAQYTITGTLDEIYAKRNWEDIEGRLYLGNYISFSDKSFQEEPIMIRIIGIKEYVNNPHGVTIEFSNQNISSTLIGSLNRLENEEVRSDDLHRQSVSYTKRRFRSAQETLDLLREAFANFSDGINPVTVRTMGMLVGDEALQFKFTESRESLEEVSCPLTYMAETKQLNAVDASLVHMTLGIDTVTAEGARTANDYMSWDIPAWQSAILDDGSKSYYVYVKASKSGTAAEYMLSEIVIEMEEVEGYYHFLVGILNSEYNETRDFVTLYGFTEVLPGQITTDVIRSADGKTYFDLANGEIGGRITFKAGSSGLKELQEWGEVESTINAKAEQLDLESFETAVNKTLGNIQDQIDGAITTWFYSGVPTLSNLPAKNWTTTAMKEQHVGDLYYDEDTGKAYRFQYSSSTLSYKWTLITDEAITEALQKAKDAQDTADGKRRVFVSQPTNASAYDVGDLWVNATYGSIYDNDLLRCKTAKAEGVAFSIDHWELASKYTDDTAANEAKARLDEWADDGKISPVEVLSIKEEITRIVNDKNTIVAQANNYGVSTTTYITRYNTYYNILSGIVTSMNNANGGSIDVPTALSTAQSNYYLARATILTNISNAAKEAIPDVEYLSNALQDGSTVVEGGLVMTSMIAVGDTSNDQSTDVQAFLNGSDLAEDSTHGKLIMAGGIPETTQSGGTALVERIAEATTKIYEDGTIIVDIPSIEGKLVLNNDGLNYYGTKADGTEYKKLSLGTTCQGTGGVFYTQDAVANFCTQAALLAVGDDLAPAIFAEGESFLRGKTSIGAYGEGTDIDPTDGVNVKNGNISLQEGIFEGMRPRIDYINSATTRLDGLYHTLVSNATSGTRTVYLPASPINGQCYEIWKNNAHSLVINGNGKNVTRMNVSTATSQTIDGTFMGLVKLVYQSSIGAWLMIIIRSS